MTTQLAPAPVFRGTDASGLPLYLGQLGTFIAGTNTPQVTYKDSAGIATNTNPVILNARGECNLWLDTSKSYKLVLSDSLGNLIWTVDNVTIGNANPSYSIIPTTDNLYNLGSPTFSWANVYAKTNSFVGPNLIPVLDSATGNIGYYVRTAAEIAASVTPTNFSYAPLDARRYGYSADNLTGSASSNVTSLSNAISVAAATVSGATGATVYMPTGIGYLNAQITLPNRVRLQGVNCSGSLFKATAGHPGPFMFFANNGTSAMFDSILQDLFIDCSDVAGLGAVRSSAWQENCGPRSVGFLNFRTYGVKFESGFGGASTCEVEQCQFFGSAIFGATAAIRVDQISSVGAFLLHVRDCGITGSPQGFILTLNTLVGGSGYVNGTYASVPLTGGAGTQATATITVSGGAVTSVVLSASGGGGFNYVVGNVLSASNVNLGGSGSGFSITVATVANAISIGVDIANDSLHIDNCHFEGCIDAVQSGSGAGGGQGSITLDNISGITGITSILHVLNTFNGRINMQGCFRNGATNLIKNDVTGEIYTSPDISDYVYPEVVSQNTLKAWCIFNGTTVGTHAPTAGYNVTNVVRNSAGNYSILFTRNLTNLNCCPIPSSNLGSAGTVISCSLVSTGRVDVLISVAGAPTDSNEVKVMVAGL